VEVPIKINASGATSTTTSCIITTTLCPRFELVTDDNHKSNLVGREMSLIIPLSTGARTGLFCEINRGNE